VAGCAHTRWQRHLRIVGNVVVAHRQRIYVLTQLLLKYGQTWRGISATHIVPGFASIYRTSALRHINISRPGLVIEDFNMTFEVNYKRLGRVAFHPDARAYTQDPDRYRDYVRQTRRWALGLWQTVRCSRRRRAVFAGALMLTLLELLTSSLMFLLLPPLILVLGIVQLVPAVADVPVLGVFSTTVATHVSFADIGLGIVLPDYLLTCVVAVMERRPRFLLAGLLFVPMKITDAVVALYTLPRAWLDRSTGQWSSPTRRAVPASNGTEVA
jgi:biofilm PGA synthesis N-glycosyltransferase PgaC